MAPEEKATDQTATDQTATDQTAFGFLGFPSSFRELFQYFCENTTVHGMIRLVCSSQNSMKTSFWALLLVLSVTLMGWQFSLILGGYLERPLLFSIRVSTGELPFPAVTVCTLNPQRPKSLADDLRALDEAAVENLHSLLGHNAPGQGGGTPDPRAPPPGPLLTSWPWLIDLKSRLRPSPTPGIRKGAGDSGSDFHSIPLVRNSSWMIGFWLCNATGTDCFLQWQSSGVWALREWYTFHYVNILGRRRPGEEEEEDEEDEGRPGNFILDCTFNGIACEKSDYSRFQHPIYGQCYTFNGDRENHGWRALMPGKGNGLSLLLNTAQTDRSPFLSTSAGARVMVHSQDTVPFLEDGGFDIQPGVETSISMHKEEVSRLGGQYGDCTWDGSEVKITNLYPGAYTQQACLRSCFQLTMVSRCGCAHYSYPLPSKSEYCDSLRHRGWGHCYFQLYKEYTGGVLGCFQTCRKPCRQTEYTMVAGYGTYPSRKSEVWTYPVLEQESGLVMSGRSSLAKLNIYYRELNFKTTRETPAIPAVMMLSSLGSQWSFWFGSSVLSVIELIELLMDMAALCFILGLGPRVRHPASPVPAPCPEAPPGQDLPSSCSPLASPPPSSPPVPSRPPLSLKAPPACKVNCPACDVGLQDGGAVP